MTLVPAIDYPKVRALLGDNEGSISDLAISEAVSLAEDFILARVPTALTETDIDLVARYQRAARYLTASILAPQMDGSANDVSQFKTGDSTISYRQRRWSDLSARLEELAWSILLPPVEETGRLGYSVFKLSKAPRVYRPI